MFIIYNWHNPTKELAIKEAFLTSLWIDNPKLMGIDLPRHWSDVVFKDDLDLMEHSSKWASELLKNFWNSIWIKDIPNWVVYLNESIVNWDYWWIWVVLVDVYNGGKEICVQWPKIKLPEQFLELHKESKNIGKSLDIYFWGHNIKFEKWVWWAFTGWMFMRKDVIANTIALWLSTMFWDI